MSHLPDLQSTGNLLKGLIGKAVQLKAGKPFPVDGAPKAPTFCGLYANDGETDPSALLVFDLPMTVVCGGSLSGLPPGVMTDQLKSGNVEDTIRENVYEIMNVAASLLNVSGTASHIRLKSVQELKGKAEGQIAQLASAKAARLDGEATIGSLPAGKFSFIRVS